MSSKIAVVKLTTITVIVAAVLALSTLATAHYAQRVMAQDKCFTIQRKDRTFTHLECFSSPDKQSVNQEKQEFKRECKETTDNKDTRCSSSQTGNGEVGNFLKQKTP